MKILLGGFLLALLIGNVQADDIQRLECGPARCHLVELYTSEGCSSCPPAEAWLSQFLKSADLWKRIVPVSFHVDYWDKLGWPDSFASRIFTERQYQYSAHWGNSSVYTPGWVVDGVEAQSMPIPSELADQQDGDAGKLTVEIRGHNVTVTFVPAQQHPANLRCEVALLGCGISSSIRGGENGGRTLEHDFVVLALNTTAMSIAPGGSIYSAMATLPESRVSCRRALALWVEDPSASRPLQAVGAWLR